MDIPLKLPFFIGCFHDRLVAAGARVIDQDVGAAKLPFRDADDLLDVLRNGDVRRYAKGSDAVTLPDSLCFGIEPLRLPRHQQQIGAFIC